jgi:L-alanine-DL-glutamate epimerase-like enolase superfamily enzyme
MRMRTSDNQSKSRRGFVKVLAGLGATFPLFATTNKNHLEPENKLIQTSNAMVSDLKITRVRFYKAPSRSMVNQSAHVVTIETDKGITGIGEGGTAFLVSQMGRLLIGKNPLEIERLWQLMYRGHFYPPGREKIHALGALDLALWDIKGKVLGVPVHLLLGGKARNYCECYVTGYPFSGSLRDRAKAAIEDGFRAYRTSVTGPREGETFNSHYAVKDTLHACKQIREGVGSDGDWCIDFHTRLDFNDAVRLAYLLEDLEPYFVEDLIRSENRSVYQTLRAKVNVPIAVGEQFGDRWDIAEMVENDLIDYSRVSLPNSGGITEFQKMAATCETHYIGLVPHFTGPIATAALVHACIPHSGPVLMEMLGKEKPALPHLPESYDFREGKMWPNERPGLGVILDTSQIELISEVTEYEEGVPQYFRQDGSFTNW